MQMVKRVEKKEKKRDEDKAEKVSDGKRLEETMHHSSRGGWRERRGQGELFKRKEICCGREIERKRREQREAGGDVSWRKRKGETERRPDGI